MSLINYPQQLGKYRLDSLLGQGAMGSVYKGFDTEIDREVAIKILHAHLLAGELGEELKQRFVHEVKAAARCQHPNIVTVFDYGLSDESPYMVMEYVKGVDLQIFLRSGHLIPANQAINMVLKVLDALHAAHAMGVVHRDIKPANIMLLDNGQVKVTDFGVVRIDSSELTQIGDVMGTPCYMSPEAHDGGMITHLSDLYTTALVLLELLIKKRLKLLQINPETIQAELTQQNLEPQLIQNLVEVLGIALQIKPKQRYQDALSFYKGLSTCVDMAADYHQLTDDLATTVLKLQSNISDATVLAPTPTSNQSSKSKRSETSLLMNQSALLKSQLNVVERSLTSYVGAVAKMLVKKQAHKTEDLEQLLDSLIEYIPSLEERKKFIASLETSGIRKGENSTRMTSI